MTTNNNSRASTGIVGLDDILTGGFVPNRLYLVEGMPGSGKTTLAFQFLLEGVRKGETVLYVTLSETAEEITAVADSHGWDLKGVTIRELVPTAETLQPAEQYTDDKSDAQPVGRAPLFEAPEAGLEPATRRLTVACSTN